MKYAAFTVPLVPPTVNHYVRHTRGGRHYVTEEAQAFKAAVAVFSPDLDFWKTPALGVALTIYLGKRMKGDADNFPKVVIDGLKGHVIRSDAAVKELFVSIDRDWANPRTEIEIWEL